MDKEGKSKDGYLDSISNSASEKADVIEYIDQLKNGRILEVGPGGGTALVEMVRSVERTFSPEDRPGIVVFDIIEEVFEKVRKAVGETDVKIDYVLGDGSKDLPFEDNSIDAVNLSAVAHELFSYGGGYSGIHKLAKECGRMMKTDGVLTYRDPDGIELHSMEEVVFTTPFARRFLAYFLPKFLDRKYTSLKDKVDLGYSETLSLELNDQPLPIDDLLILNPETLERGGITLRAKTGLVNEIQRHFVLFAKNIASIDMSGQEDKNGSAEILKDKVFFQVDNQAAVKAIDKFLAETGIVFTCQKKTFELTIAALNMLHARIREIANHFESDVTINPEAMRALEWGTREGEENYFYGSSEEIVSRFTHFSLIKDGSGELGYSCLCPISTNSIKSVERVEHSRFIKQHLERKSEELLKDRKRHIHFRKMPLEKAFPILLNYYRETRHPAVLETLQHFMFILREFSGVKSDMQELSADPGEGVQKCMDVCSAIASKEKVENGIIEVRSLLAVPHLGVIGGMASGKTTISEILAARNYNVISLSAFVRAEALARGIEKPTRDDYFNVSNIMRRDYGRDILARLAIKKVIDDRIERFVLDGMRNPEEIDFFRQLIRDFVLIGVETDTEERIRRIQSRLRDIDNKDHQRILGDMDREFFDPSPDGCRLSQVLSLADFYINGNLSSEANRIKIETLKIPCSR